MSPKPRRTIAKQQVSKDIPLDIIDNYNHWRCFPSVIWCTSLDQAICHRSVDRLLSKQPLCSYGSDLESAVLNLALQAGGTGLEIYNLCISLELSETYIEEKD